MRYFVNIYIRMVSEQNEKSTSKTNANSANADNDADSG